MVKEISQLKVKISQLQHNTQVIENDKYKCTEIKYVSVYLRK